MNKNKIIDCITFFDNNLTFEIRYNILKDCVDFFVICESLYDHTGKQKKQNFIFKKNYDEKKIKYILLENPFPIKANRWERQAIQREAILKNINFASPDDFIFFSDPDEIVRPEILDNFQLNRKYGIFLQDCFVYKINLFNKYESPWEGTRVARKKNLKSIDFMRHKVKMKNLNYSFFRFDKERNIQIYKNAGWHFNNLMPPKDISLKLKTFAHEEFSGDEFASLDIINEKIEKKIDLFNRGHTYVKKSLDKSFPKYILDNLDKYKEYII